MKKKKYWIFILVLIHLCILFHTKIYEIIYILFVFYNRRSLIKRLFSNHIQNLCYFVPSRRRHTKLVSDWSSDVCSSDLGLMPCHFQGKDTASGPLAGVMISTT